VGLERRTSSRLDAGCSDDLLSRRTTLALGERDGCGRYPGRGILTRDAPTPIVGTGDPVWDAGGRSFVTVS
jgi:hypothetical protein